MNKRPDRQPVATIPLGVSSVRVGRNVVATFVGRGWTALAGFVFVPLYLHFLGIESYGLVGFFATLQAFFNLLDLGLGGTLNREFARFAADEHSRADSQNLLRTLEIIYWCVTLIVALSLFAAAPWVASRWIHAGSLGTGTVTTSVRLMALTLVVQFPFALYQSGLMGLQRHVLLNAILTAVATLRGVGAVFTLWIVSRTIQAFFVWQLIVSLAATAATAMLVWRLIRDPKQPPRFEVSCLERVWRFAAGLAAMAAVNVMFTQTDKLILSKSLKLDDFGYYMLGQSLAGALWSIVLPFSLAVFPRFSQLAATNAVGEISSLYHRACQSLSVLLLPTFLILVFFSREILLTWTSNPVAAMKSAPIVSLAACAIVSICIGDIPHFLRLAYGWYRLSLFVNVTLVLCFIPLLIVMISRFGMIGAAATWAGVNAVYLITVPITHTRILRGEFARWVREDIGLPLAGALSVMLLAAAVHPPSLSRPAELLFLASTWSSATIAAGLVSSGVRGFVFMTVRRWSMSLFP